MGFRAPEARSTRWRHATAWLLVALAVRAAPIAAVLRTPAVQSNQPPATGSPARPAAARARDAGLPNFGVVSEQLYRGAQPEERGFAELARLGIGIVVNFRHERDRIARDRTLVEGLGMQYVSIPWRGHDDPNTEQVAQFLRLLRDNPERTVFVHCERGAERTGVMIACYRISREQWSPERAQAEMEAFGFRRRFAHLTRFVREFPSLLRRDPVLRSTVGRAASPARLLTRVFERYRYEPENTQPLPAERIAAAQTNSYGTRQFVVQRIPTDGSSAYENRLSTRSCSHDSDPKSCRRAGRGREYLRMIAWEPATRVF